MANCRLTRQMLPAAKTHSGLGELLRGYKRLTEMERNDILDFQVRFEEIFPFEDGNGRVGRRIMFKEYTETRKSATNTKPKDCKQNIV